MLKTHRAFPIAARLPIILLLLTTIASAFQAGAPWKTFNSAEGRFSVLMPSDPKVEVKDVDSAVGKLTLYTYSSSSSAGYLMASYGDYPREPSGTAATEKVLDDVTSGVLKSLGGEKVSENKIKLKGPTYAGGTLVEYPGREFTANKTLESGEVVFSWKIYLVGRRLYQLAMVTSKAQAGDPEVQKFLGSFEVKGQ
ncbi:MAG TPA: hypothetical protein VGW36_08890 [Pyrinomonadaceae bacterium]|nr:hypothetical protein [Pyrinomonadaceae bacterium]